jgi:hypothetical protein
LTTKQKMLLFQLVSLCNSDVKPIKLAKFTTWILITGFSNKLNFQRL